MFENIKTKLNEPVPTWYAALSVAAGIIGYAVGFYMTSRSEVKNVAPAAPVSEEPKA